MTPFRFEKHQKVADDVALEIGRFVIAWNDLQHSLEKFFSYIINGTSHGMPNAAWHAVASDRTQREMLRAICEREMGITSISKEYKQKTRLTENLKKEVDWIIEQTNSMGETRNSIIHAPYIVFIDKDDAAALIPMWFYSHPKAKYLYSKGDLLEFVRWHKAKAESLAYYGHRLMIAVEHGKPFPDRPLLPTRGQKTARRDSRRQSPEE